MYIVGRQTGQHNLSFPHDMQNVVWATNALFEHQNAMTGHLTTAAAAAETISAVKYENMATSLVFSLVFFIIDKLKHTRQIQDSDFDSAA